jgi:hypothetical protein
MTLIKLATAEILVIINIAIQINAVPKHVIGLKAPNIPK